MNHILKNVFVAIALFFIACADLSAQVLQFEQAKQRADKGDAFAQAVVAIHYQIGWETEKNIEQAVKYATASAKAKHALGLFRVGTMLRNGEGFAKDEKKGLDLQRLSYKALKEAKDPYSITSTAIMIFQGKVVGKDLSEDERRRIAANLYKRAADMGYAPAQFNYAMAAGSGYGVAKDLRLRDRYLTLSAAQCYPLALKKSRDLSGAQAPSFVKGIHRETEWFYGFIKDTGGVGVEKLISAKETGLPVYLDDDWIVTKTLCPDGTGFASSVLRFYDARSLLLKYTISVPNDVFHLDFSPSRNQFLLLTACGYKNLSSCLPHDLDQALVLLDLKVGVLERIRLWQEDEYHLQWNGECAPRWKDNSIEIPPPANPDRLPNHSAKAIYKEFSDVSLVFLGKQKRDHFIPSSKNIDKRVLEPIGLTDSLTESSYSRSVFGICEADVGAVHLDGNKSNVIVRFAGGFLDRLNLSTLHTEFRRARMSPIDGMGLLQTGVVWVLSNDVLSLIGPIRDTQIELLDIMEAPKAVGSNEGFGKTPKTYFSRWRDSYTEKRSDNMQLDATSNSLYVARLNGPEIFIKKISDSGLISKEVVHLNEKMSRTSREFTLDARRSSLAFVYSKDDSDKFFWTDSEWTTGRIKTRPILLDAAAPRMYVPEDCFYGNAAPGWILISSLSGESKWAGARSNNVLATEEISGRRFNVSDGPHRHKEPLVLELNKARDSALVVSCGETAARVEKLNLATGNVKRLREWSWQPGLGPPLYEGVTKRLWIPSKSGYDIYQIGEGGPLEELSFLGELVTGDPGEYAIVLSDGHYAGSPGCENLLRLKAGNGNVDASSLAPWRNRPADVLKALGGDTEQIEILAKMTERWLKRIGHDSNKPEPTAEDILILSVEMPPLWAKGSDIEIPIKITPKKSPISNVSVRVNGVECASVMGQFLSKTNDGNLETVVSLRIAEGQNWIEVTAIDEMGRKSDSQRFRTILKETQPPRRYVVACGVSKYLRSEFDLAFAAKDAKDLTSSLSNTDTKSLILTDDEVDGDAIGKIQEFLAASQEDDEVILFCAGHGVLDANLDYIFARHDFDLDRPNETGIKLDDLIGAVGAGKSLKRLILLDTCHSGMIGEKEEALMASADFKLPDGVRSIKQRGMIVSKAGELTSGAKQRFIEEMFLLPGTHRGVNIIGASGGAEYALESGQWNNGVFTASVIEGLRDKKADWDKDEDVSVSELRDYLGQRIPELTGNAQKPSVVAFERDQDFVLAR